MESGKVLAARSIGLEAGRRSRIAGLLLHYQRSAYANYETEMRSSLTKQIIHSWLTTKQRDQGGGKRRTIICAATATKAKRSQSRFRCRRCY